MVNFWDGFEKQAISRQAYMQAFRNAYKKMLGKEMDKPMMVMPGPMSKHPEVQKAFEKAHKEHATASALGGMKKRLTQDIEKRKPRFKDLFTEKGRRNIPRKNERLSRRISALEELESTARNQ